MRHAITKLSNLHFVVCEEYRNRIIQMGESEETVINVGGLGIDAIKKLEVRKLSDLEQEFPYIRKKKYLIATMHPETHGNNKTGREQISEVVNAAVEMIDIITIFTYPNADSKGREMIEIIEKAAEKHQNIYAEKSLGMKNYLSLCKYSNGVIGNSSSGILEIPYLKVPVINIGRRQEGRVQPSGILNTENKKEDIQIAIEKILKKGYRENIIYSKASNPYGSGGAAKYIVRELSKKRDFSKNKLFIDIDSPKYH